MYPPDPTNGRQTTFRILLFAVLLLAIAISCDTVSDISQDVGEVRETAQALGTSVQSGRELLQTGQAVVTQVSGNPLWQTAQAAAEEQGPRMLATLQAVATEQGPGMQQTLQAFATQQGPAMQQTLQAFATQQGPGLARTAEAVATEQGPRLAETASALATQAAVAAGSAGERPEDIPIVENPNTLITTAILVSYQTAIDMRSVAAFYEAGMPSLGWSPVEAGSIDTDQAIILNFEKPGRAARVAISRNPLDGQTVVVVQVQESP